MPPVLPTTWQCAPHRARPKPVPLTDQILSVPTESRSLPPRPHRSGMVQHVGRIAFLPTHGVHHRGIARPPRAGVKDQVAAHTLPKSFRWAGFEDKSGGLPPKHPTTSPACSNADTKGVVDLLCAIKADSARRTSSDLLKCACSLSCTNSCSKAGGILMVKVFMAQIILHASRYDG